MASITVTGLCPGGNHILMTITTSRGTKTVNRSLAELRQAVAESSVEDLIVAQLAAIVRANPSATLPQLRTIVQNTTFLE